VFDARREARRILAEAAAEGEAVLARAREEAGHVVSGAGGLVEEARRAAAEEGRAEGLEEGLARAAAEVLRGGRERERLLAGSAADALDLAVAMAARILEREVRPGADAAACTVRALAVVAGAGRPVVQAAAGEAEGLAADLGSAGIPARIVTDPALRPGEVVVRSGPATVDGTFRARLERLRRAVGSAGR
jgi:flagellar biosynthesis/type III secretory pathway protein FliH